jgi:hypothetical protein
MTQKGFFVYVLNLGTMTGTSLYLKSVNPSVVGLGYVTQFSFWHRHTCVLTNRSNFSQGSYRAQRQGSWSADVQFAGAGRVPLA